MVQEKKSLFSKLIDKIKNTALYNMFFNPDYGEVIAAEDLDSDKRIDTLVKSSDSSESEIMGIERAFNEAENSLSPIIDEISKTPKETKESYNPFKLEEDELNHDEQPTVTRQTRNSRDREIED